MQIFVSGIHSGPDPSSGVGVARSLKSAFPQARMVGVDYSAASSGIHYEVFDDIWVQRPWNELDLDLYHDQVAHVLQGEAAWIPCLDLEVQWLAKAFPEEPKILAPRAAALEQISKPAVPAARYLPMTVPEYTLADKPNWELHSFCRRAGWPVWCKGPNHEARLAWNWMQVLAALVDLREKWAVRQPALQAHVQGSEESVVFAAWDGKLLDCLHMEKRLQTLEGKTWAGVISEVDPVIGESVERVIASLRWTGGGELEFIRDDRGALHLFDWNPRFPAWIHGATIAGHNLPGQLVQAAGLGVAHHAPCISREFARVVLEVPTRPQYPLPEPPPSDRSGPAGKHPSGMTLLAKRLADERPEPVPSNPATVPSSFLEDLSNMAAWELGTPHRVFLPKTAQQVFHQTENVLGAGRDLGISVSVGYSVKTNPHPALMELARQGSFFAEVINGLEFKHARECGFPLDRIILNGPAQGWPEEPLSQALHAAFADSTERLKWFLDNGVRAHFLGVRLRPSMSWSRFGADLSTSAGFANLVELLRQFHSQPLGVHFHIQSDVIGVRPWQDVYEGMLHSARALQEQSGQAIRILDVGGGWFPDDFAEEFGPRLPELLKQAKYLLPKLEQFVVEPGKALCQPCMALVTRVLEVRRPQTPKGHVDVVVDGSIADLPLAQVFPHRILALLHNGGAVPLPDGNDRVLGRNCMEFDFLATTVGLPEGLCEGDKLVFCDAGAYDASMSYDFATGRIRNT